MVSCLSRQTPASESGLDEYGPLFAPRCKLVELAGIEPASEHPSDQGSYARIVTNPDGHNDDYSIVGCLRSEELGFTLV